MTTATTAKNGSRVDVDDDGFGKGMKGKVADDGMLGNGGKKGDKKTGGDDDDGGSSVGKGGREELTTVTAVTMEVGQMFAMITPGKE